MLRNFIITKQIGVNVNKAINMATSIFLHISLLNFFQANIFDFDRCCLKKTNKAKKR